eukprot:148873_1
MSTQQQKSELLTFGYVSRAYNGIIPFQLMKLMQLFYDDWIYWILKDKKLTQFTNAKLNEMICAKSFRIKGIEFEIISHPNGCIDKRNRTLNGVVIIGLKVKSVPTYVESFQFYREIKCEALNTSVKRLYEIQSPHKPSS